MVKKKEEANSQQEAALQFTVSTDLFQDVIVSFGSDLELLQEYLGGVSIKDDLHLFENCEGLCLGIEDGRCILWMNRIPVTHYDLGVLSHEVFHCVHRILDFTRISLEDSTEEIYARVTEHLIVNIYGKLGV